MLYEVITGRARIWQRHGGTAIELPHEHAGQKRMVQSAVFHPIREELVVTGDYAGGVWLWRFDGEHAEPVYAQASAFLQRPAAEALARVAARLAGDGFGLLVFDGYRPWSVTKWFWDRTPRGKREFSYNFV